MIQYNVKKINIEEFIEKFKEYNIGNCLENTFSKGFCYWFAFLLKERFPSGSIWYMPIKNHFIFLLNDEFYDIKGKISFDKNEVIYDWLFYQDEEPEESSRIIRDCVLKNKVFL